MIEKSISVRFGALFFGAFLALRVSAAPFEVKIHDEQITPNHGKGIHAAGDRWVVKLISSIPLNF
jgi:hypothetical protein